jgi:hypothetical protein
MATIVTRAGKGSPLTNTEVDANFTNLNTDKLEKSGGTMTGDLIFGDNDKAIFGAGSDLQIYHDGAASYVMDTGTGNLQLRGDNSVALRSYSTTDNYLVANFNSSVDIYYDNALKLATTSTGIDVTGTVVSDGLDVFGTNNSELVNISGNSNQSRGLSISTYAVSAQDNTGVRFAAPTASSIYGTLTFATNGNDRLNIEANGDISFYEDTGTTPKFFWDASAERLGIGTSSPAKLLHIYSDSGNADVRVQGGGASDYTSLYHGSSASGLYNSGTTPMVFSTNNQERMRIDTSGKVHIGRTASVNSQAGWSCFDSGRVFMTSNVTDFIYEIIEYNGSRIGGIATNLAGNSVSYNTSSDYRLKTDVQPMTGATERLKALNPVNFEWISSGKRVDGFLAHEAQEVVPEAVTGEKDAVEAFGNVTDAEGTVVQENVTEPDELAEGQTWTKTEDRPVYQGIDQAKLVPLLTAALQEAVAKIEALETRIAALEV